MVLASQSVLAFTVPVIGIPANETVSVIPPLMSAAEPSPSMPITQLGAN